MASTASKENNRLQKIFRAAEKTAELSPNFVWTKEEKINESKRLRKAFENGTDEGIYQEIVAVTFFSGFNAVTVNSKLPAIFKHFGDPKKVSGYSENGLEAILKDKNIIRNNSKIRACWKNAKKFVGIAKEHGSVKEWILGFGAYEDDERLANLISELRKNFDYLGPRTVYHPLADWGFPVVKPDRMVTRVLYRLGFIPSEDDSEQNIEAVQTTCPRFARLTGYSIRYVDSVFVSIGQVGEADICRDKEPRRDLCHLTPYCSYPECH